MAGGLFFLYLPTVKSNHLHISLRAAFYLLITGFAAWATGTPLIFPSLGPTAYILAYDMKRSHTARVVIGGHFCGVIAGLICYHFIASPHHLALFATSFSTGTAFLTISSAAALALAIFLMLLFKVSHPPACATTLIISLGILPAWSDGLYILLAVLLMYGAYRLFRK